MSKNTKNPSTEGKALATSTTATDTAASTTATSTASTDTSATKATAASDTTKGTTTEQNTSGTTSATDSTASMTANGETAAPEQATAASVPADYLTGGYFRGEGKKRYTDPALIGQAEAIGKALAESGVPANAVRKMVRTLKTAARLPYEAQQGALKKLTPVVLDLEHKKKAPALLREVVERNQAAVQSEADFKACLDHFKDIAIYLTDAQA